MSSESDASPEVVLPRISVKEFLANPTDPAALEQCRLAAEGLHQYGVLIVSDERVTEADNARFLDMMEQYFEQPEEKTAGDIHPELSYQVGATPSFVELPRNHCDRMKAYKDADAPLSLCPPELDPKWRFFWRIGARPESTKYEELNAEPVIPAAFPQWGEVLNTWGSKMVATLDQVAQMAALGFGLPQETFLAKARGGPHLLAPTGSNFAKFGKLGTVLAGFHYDLNFMTIHGKSRYPGLFIWTREGKRVPVRVPDGCLLVQAGKQFEYITAGHVLAGHHEVIVAPETVAAIARATEAGKSLWRASSTLFYHVNSDQSIAPVGHFSTAPGAEAYPALEAGEQVRKELEHIKLGGPAKRLAAEAEAEAGAGAGTGEASA